jgi:hypothetical protein
VNGRAPSRLLSGSESQSPTWTTLRLCRLVFALVLLSVATHSIILGLTLLFDPRWALDFVGWEYTGQLFWPSQAGLFLIILGVAYAMALRLRPLVWLVIGSKACAVAFLLASTTWLQAPPISALLGLVDGLMGLAVGLTFWRLRRAELPRQNSWEAAG